MPYIWNGYIWMSFSFFRFFFFLQKNAWFYYQQTRTVTSNYQEKNMNDKILLAGKKNHCSIFNCKEEEFFYTTAKTNHFSTNPQFFPIFYNAHSVKIVTHQCVYRRFHRWVSKIRNVSEGNTHWVVTSNSSLLDSSAMLRSVASVSCLFRLVVSSFTASSRPCKKTGVCA